jgi:hypothetical protein
MDGGNGKASRHTTSDDVRDMGLGAVEQLRDAREGEKIEIL